MSFIENLTGKVFGKLTVIEMSGYRHNRVAWLCKCDCGGEKIVCAHELKNGDTKSCGCAKRNPKKHGKSYSRIHYIWRSMKNRCNNLSDKNYGGRGIKVCDEWQKFIPFMKWAENNGYSDLLEIDRIDNNGDYSPENCRFVTKITNANNKRNNHPVTINGVTKNLNEWARYSGVESHTIFYRVKRGWQNEKIIQPVKYKEVI